MTLLEQLQERCRHKGECWEWCGSVNGAGVLVFGKERYPARRLMWEAVGRKLQGSLPIIQVCGNKLCVNPEHLQVATKQEVAARTGKEGRLGTLEKRKKIAQARRSKSTLTMEKVHEIRLSGETAEALAPVYGVTASTIKHIRAHETWRDYENEFSALLPASMRRAANDSKRRAA